jgi:hypothetical protein
VTTERPKELERTDNVCWQSNGKTLIDRREHLVEPGEHHQLYKAVHAKGLDGVGLDSVWDVLPEQSRVQNQRGQAIRLGEVSRCKSAFRFCGPDGRDGFAIGRG